VKSQCELSRIQRPAYFNRWINLRETFHQCHPTQRKLHLSTMLVGKNEGTKSDVTKISSSPSVSLSTPRDDPRASLDIWEDTPRCPSDAQDVPMTPVTSTSCPAMSWGLLVTDPATPAAAFFLLLFAPPPPLWKPPFFGHHPFV